MLYQERPYIVDLPGTVFDIDAVIDKSDRKIFRQDSESLSQVTVCTMFSILKPVPTVLISFVRGNIHDLMLTVQYSQFKNCHINRCLFKYV